MMKKYILWIVVVIAIIVAAGWLFWPKYSAMAPSPKEGISVVAPLPNAVVSSPLIISGTVMGGGWIGFEAQVGTVRLLDANGQELGLAILTATTEWTLQPTYFQTTLEFGVPGTDTGTLVFHNENPSGEAERDKTFVVPVKFK